MHNLRERLLSIDDLPVKEILVPGWGSVALRTLSAADQDAILRTDETGSRLCALVATLAVVDIWGGKRVFEATDVDALAQKSALALRTIFEAVLDMSRVSEESVGAAEKKSETTF
jgi:hypothetical protein